MKEKWCPLTGENTNLVIDMARELWDHRRLERLDAAA